MKESIAFPELSIKYKMDVGVHKTKCQNNNPELSGNDKCPVHAIGEIFIIIEEGIYGIAVCAEVPAISCWIIFAFGEKCVKGKVRLHLPEQVIIYLHLHFQRLLWLLCRRR